MDRTRSPPTSSVTMSSSRACQSADTKQVRANLSGRWFPQDPAKLLHKSLLSGRRCREQLGSFWNEGERAARRRNQSNDNHLARHRVSVLYRDGHCPRCAVIARRRFFEGLEQISDVRFGNEIEDGLPEQFGRAVANEALAARADPIDQHALVGRAEHERTARRLVFFVCVELRYHLYQYSCQMTLSKDTVNDRVNSCNRPVSELR